MSSTYLVYDGGLRYLQLGQLLQFFTTNKNVCKRWSQRRAHGHPISLDEHNVIKSHRLLTTLWSSKLMGWLAMGSPLGLTLANIFVGYQELQKLTKLQVSQSPIVYCRYVDDIFCLFDSCEVCDRFLNELNYLHPALKFTTELECSGCLPFLDVLVERSASSFTTSIYRKPTFTGQYTR